MSGQRSGGTGGTSDGGSRGGSGSAAPRRLGASTYVSIGLFGVLLFFLIGPGTPTSARIGAGVVSVLVLRRIWVDVRDLLDTTGEAPAGPREKR
jgi:hypothetical protein